MNCGFRCAQAQQNPEKERNEWKRTMYERTQSDPESLFIDVECTTCGTDCMCGPQERVLRRIIEGTYPHLPMTPEQREWCAQEADSAGEGSYDAAELLNLDDVELARTVMRAWSDYVQSNCL